MQRLLDSFNNQQVYDIICTGIAGLLSFHILDSTTKQLAASSNTLIFSLFDLALRAVVTYATVYTLLKKNKNDDVKKSVNK